MKPRLELIIMFLLVVVPAGYLEAALYIDDTSTTDKGHFNLEFILDYYKDIEREFDPEVEEYNKTISKELALTSRLSYGLQNNWEIGVTTPYRFLDDTDFGKVNGFADMIIDTKYRIFEEKNFFPSFALYFDLKTKTGNEDKSLGTGEKNFSVNNIFTKCIGKNIFDLNSGYTFVGGKPDNIFFYAFDWTHNLTENLCVCNELYIETTLKESYDKGIFVYALSLSYQLSKMICLDSGVGIGISKASPGLQISTTATFNF